MTGTTVCDATMPGQMGGAAGAGDDHLEPAAGGRRRVLGHQRRRAMRRDDFRLVRHAERVQDFGGMPHRVPVRLAAHDDADERRRLRHGAI